MTPLVRPSSQLDVRAQSGELSSAPGVPEAGDPAKLAVTGQQQGYLDALKAAGVQPSSDLMALSIGSYVCQARAARQNDQAVRASVVPLVRSDVRAVHAGDDGAPLTADVDAATASYIRTATDHLC